MKIILCLLFLTSTSFAFEMNLEVQDSWGRLQKVKVSAEYINKFGLMPTMFMPHVIFPNGDYALIDSDSDLDQVICERLIGQPVASPYRDFRISFAQILSYRRGLVSGTYSVRGNQIDGYYEELITGFYLQIITLGCSAL